MKYCGFINTRVNLFKVKSHRPYQANMRCKICGDSQKSKTKARGWLLEQKDGNIIYYCHNCNVSLSFDNFLKHIDPVLYDEYIIEAKLEKYGERKKSDVEIFADKMKQPTFIKTTPLKNLKKISQLNWDHPAKRYIQSRLIPPQYHSKLFYAPKFKAFIHSLFPDKYPKIEKDEPRLIIPFLDENKNIFGLQGRSFSNDGLRYLTYMLDDSKTKIFGLDTCNMNSPYYILEGPIDSMFVNNAIGMAGGSVDYSVLNNNAVFVYDNEPRNKNTIKRMQKSIHKGFKVVIFPEYIKEKDINLMIQNNPKMDINKLLSENIYQDLQAEMRLIEWKKI